MTRQRFWGKEQQTNSLSQLDDRRKKMYNVILETLPLYCSELLLDLYQESTQKSPLKQMEGPSPYNDPQ